MLHGGQSHFLDQVVEDDGNQRFILVHKTLRYPQQAGPVPKASSVTILSALKIWARNLKRDVVALWIAARDPRVAWYAKWTAGAVAAYALSPIDLIPDFIPIFGYLDDLIIVPLGIALVVRMIPAPLMADFREQALATEARPQSNVGLAFIVAVWLAAGAASAIFIWRYISI